MAMSGRETPLPPLKFCPPSEVQSTPMSSGSSPGPLLAPQSSHSVPSPRTLRPVWSLGVVCTPCPPAPITLLGTRRTPVNGTQWLSPGPLSGTGHEACEPQGTVVWGQPLHPRTWKPLPQVLLGPPLSSAGPGPPRQISEPGSGAQAQRPCQAPSPCLGLSLLPPWVPARGLLSSLHALERNPVLCAPLPWELPILDTLPLLDGREINDPELCSVCCLAPKGWTVMLIDGLNSVQKKRVRVRVCVCVANRGCFQKQFLEEKKKVLLLP